VRPKVVVAVSEVFDNDTGFGQGPELLAVKALVPEPAMEALVESPSHVDSEVGRGTSFKVAGEE
jgi:hypothetical protein